MDNPSWSEERIRIMTKRTVDRLSLIVILASVIFAFSITIAFGHTELTQSLRDVLLQPNASIYQKFGYSEDTLVFFNLLKLQEVCQDQATRIKVLEDKVAGLEALTIVDPNLGLRIEKLEEPQLDLRKNCGENSCLLKAKCSKHIVEETIQPGKPDYPDSNEVTE